MAQDVFQQHQTTTPRLRLRLLATTDLHAHILPWDDLAERPVPDRGLAQVASLIAAARAEVPHSLLLDNGDFLNGSPLAEHIAETRLPSAARPHPMIAAMNRLGYDAATLGNHEFSNGLSLLTRSLRHAAFPVVATNLDRLTAGPGSPTRRPFLPRHLILRRHLPDQSGHLHPVSIGILGFLPPQTVLWERRHLAGRIATRSILAAAREALPKLRRAGVDVVVALSHSGLGGLEPIEADHCENISRALAALDGIDAVIAGHTHQAHPPAPQETSLVLPGCFGSHLGVIDLDLEPAPPGDPATGWRVIRHRAELRPVAERQGADGRISARVTPDPAIMATAEADTAAFRQRAAQPAGHTDVPLHSYFAMIGHSAVQTLLAEAQAHNMRRLLAGLPEADLPLVVAVAPFKAGGRSGPGNYTDIPPGPLTARHISDLYIHPNSPVALRVTGRDLALWLERAVSLFRQIAPGSRDTRLIDPDFPAYNLDMIHGLTHGIDLSQPARFDCLGRVANPTAHRITDLRHQGQPVAPDQPFVLVTNSYRASGGAGFAGTDPADVVMEDSRPLRRILQDHVAACRTVAPAAATGWRFAPMPGTTAVFDSGQGAAAHATDVPGLERAGPCPTGFLRFRLHL